MKKYILLIILCMALATGATLNTIPQDPGQRASTTSVQGPGRAIATVTADDSALAITTSNWDDCVVLFTQIPVEWSNVSVSFYGYGDGDGTGDPNDATFSYDVYVCDYYGGAECISSANTGAIGAQQLSVNPATGASLNSEAPNTSYCWADTLTEGTKNVSRTIGYSDYEGNNGRAKFYIDRYEAYGIYVRIYNMTAQSVTSITAVLNGFNQ